MKKFSKNKIKRHILFAKKKIPFLLHIYAGYDMKIGKKKKNSIRNLNFVSDYKRDNEKKTMIKAL